MNELTSKDGQEGHSRTRLTTWLKALCWKETWHIQERGLPRAKGRVEKPGTEKAGVRSYRAYR